MLHHPALVLLSLVACDSTDERELGEWTAVENESSAQLRLTWDEAPDTRSSATVSVDCPGDNASYIETVVDDDTLYVRADNEAEVSDCEVVVPASSLRQLRVSGQGNVESDATFPELERIEVTGQGNVQLAAVTSPALDVRVRGGGNVALGWLESESATIDLSGTGEMAAAGAVDEGRLDVSGAGDFWGADLVFNHLVADLSGSGNAEINVAGTAEVTIRGSGSVTVFGDGGVYAVLKGSGTLLFAE